MRRWFAVSVALFVVLAAVGCSDSEVIGSGNFLVDFQVAATGAEPFDCVVMTFAALRIRPLDGTCSAGSTNAGAPCGVNGDCTGGGVCDGAQAASLINQSITILPPSLGNLSLTGSVCTASGFDGGKTDLPQIVLSSGRYLISSLLVAEPKLISGATVQKCVGQTGLASAYPAPLIITVGENQSNVVRFVMDVAALDATLDESEPPCGTFIANALAIGS